MQGQRAWGDRLFGDGVGNQLLSQLGALPGRDYPAHDVAAEDIEDHIQVKAGPLARHFQLGDVPAPNLVWVGGQQFGFGIGRMQALGASFDSLTGIGEQAIHGAHRTEVDALIEQCGINGGRRAVGETLAIEGVKQGFAFRLAERQRGGLA